MGLSLPSYNGREGLERRGMRMLRSLCSGPIAGRNEGIYSVRGRELALPIGRQGRRAERWVGRGKATAPGEASAGLGVRRPETPVSRPPCCPNEAFGDSPACGHLAAFLPGPSHPGPGELSFSSRFLASPFPPGTQRVRRLLRERLLRLESGSFAESGGSRPPERRELGEETWDEGRGVSFTL